MTSSTGAMTNYGSSSNIPWVPVCGHIKTASMVFYQFPIQFFFYIRFNKIDYIINIIKVKNKFYIKINKVENSAYRMWESFPLIFLCVLNRVFYDFIACYAHFHDIIIIFVINEISLTSELKIIYHHNKSFRRGAIINMREDHRGSYPTIIQRTQG